jgi:CBS domain-containing protein
MLENSPITAEDLMTREVRTVHPETPLQNAVRTMADNRLGGLVVVDAENHPVGMITIGDLLRYDGEFTARQSWWLQHLSDGHELAASFLNAIRSQNRRVKALMSEHLIVVEPDTPAREVARLFYEHRIKRLPVVRDGKLVGVVSRTDLLRAFTHELAETA